MVEAGPKSILIVGGSSEIGSALARRWVAAGAERVTLTQRQTGAVDHLEAELVASGAAVAVVSLDAAVPKSIGAAISNAWEIGEIDVAVVTIGRLEAQDAVEADPSRAAEILTVNTTATIQAALEIANHMEQQSRGTLVLLSSVAGQRGRRDNYVYGASKAALDTFAEGLRQRLAGSPVQVLLVRPGYVHSRMSKGVKPAPFAVTVEQSAEKIVGAVERGQKDLWIPSHLRVLFFVMKLLPRPVWAWLVSRVR